MFIKRAISVIVLVPIVIWIILDTSQQIFQLISAIISLWAAWEWSNIAGLKTTYQRSLYVIAIFAVLSVAQFIPSYILMLGGVWWLISIVLLIRYAHDQSKKNIIKLTLLMGFLVIIPAWVGLNSLRASDYGAHMLLFFFLLLWAIDTGAYLIGSQFGKRKLAPMISPGKTIEGVIGGLGFMAIVLFSGMIIMSVPYRHWLGLMSVSIIMSIFAVIGDLFESMLKRKIGIKDSGHVIPGHGGILDRLDSLLAAAPIFALGLHLIGLGN